MDMTLSNDEQTLLVSLLQQELGNVREQVYKSEDHNYRDELKQREVLVQALLKRLEANVAG